MQEQYVEVAGDQLKLNWEWLRMCLQASVEHLLELSDGISADYESELNLRAAPWLRALSERLAAG